MPRYDVRTSNDPGPWRAYYTTRRKDPDQQPLLVHTEVNVPRFICPSTAILICKPQLLGCLSSRGGGPQLVSPPAPFVSSRTGVHWVVLGRIHPICSCGSVPQIPLRLVLSFESFRGSSVTAHVDPLCLGDQERIFGRSISAVGPTATQSIWYQILSGFCISGADSQRHEVQNRWSPDGAEMSVSTPTSSSRNVIILKPEN